MVVNGGSNGQGHKTHQRPKHGTEGYLKYTNENEKGKGNQLDVGTRKINTIITKPGRGEMQLRKTGIDSFYEKECL